VVADIEVEPLQQPPSLPRLYATAALTARGRTGKGPLPERALRLAGVRVDRERLLRYQHLCGFQAGDLLPHTWPQVLGFPLQTELMARRDFPLPLPGLVHLENTITVHRPLTADDVLELTVRAERLREHPKGLLVDLVTEVGVAGEQAWTGRSTYLSRGRSHDVTPPARSPEPPPGDPAAVWRLPGDTGRRYAAVSGDVNPIHLHPLAARAMGFPRAIAHGMYSTARVLATLGPTTSSPSTSRVWFRKPLLLPGTVALAVEHRDGGEVLAALRSRDGRIEHLVLAWRPAG
jgi:acyl dehydratase